ncbi:MAG: hypothetical protein ACRDY5_10820, partial [Acidimicrobiales bacterium]
LPDGPSTGRELCPEPGPLRSVVVPSFLYGLAVDTAGNLYVSGRCADLPVVFMVGSPLPG